MSENKYIILIIILLILIYYYYYYYKIYYSYYYYYHSYSYYYYSLLIIIIIILIIFYYLPYARFQKATKVMMMLTSMTLCFLIKLASEMSEMIYAKNDILICKQQSIVIVKQSYVTN